jgi:CubicO group peptidase (beta-lactamase class C family)
LLFESYYARGRIDLSHPQSSTTKVYTTLALGRAIQLGYISIADLDKPIVSFLDGLDPSRFVEGVNKISLHQALNMNSGLQISDEDFAKYREDPAQYNGIRQVQAYLEDSAPISADNQTFNYVGADPIMVMQVLDAVVPGPVEEFIRSELLGKLGITDYSWRNHDSGPPMAETGSSFTSRDMLKVANMVIDNGRWDGVQILPQEFIRRLGHRYLQLTDEQTEGFYSGDKLSNSGYAYYWWPLDITVGNKKYSATSTHGAGGITIIIVEELEVVVVMTGHTRQSFLQMIAEKILPAFTKD